MTSFTDLSRAFLGQGVAFGFGDEIEAYARSLQSEQSYDEILADVRKDIDNFREAEPLTALGAELGGALATGFSGLYRLGIRGAATGAAAVGRSAVVGAGEGALFGMGVADPDEDLDISESFIDRGLGAAFGAGSGAILGGIGGAIGSKLAKKAIRKEAEKISLEAAERTGKAIPEEETARLAEAMESGIVQRQIASENALNGVAEGAGKVNTSTMDQVFDAKFWGKFEEVAGDPQKLQQLQDQTAKKFGELITVKTGRDNLAGATTDAMVEHEVQKLVSMGLDHKTASQIFNKAVPVEEMAAATNMTNAAIVRTGFLRDTMMSFKAGTPEAVKAEAEFLQHFLQTGTLVTNMLGFQANLGRSMRRLQRQFVKFDQGFDPKELAKLAEGAVGMTGRELGDRLGGLAPNQAGNYINQIIRNPKLAKDAAFEVWLNGLLSGPRTQAVNAFSNMVNAFLVAPTETFLAAGADAIGTAAKRAGGKDAKRSVFFRESAIEFSSSVKSIGEGLRAFGKAFSTETSAFRGTKIDTQMGNVPGKVGKFVRLPGKLLLASDDLFKTISYRSKLNSLSYREAKRSLKKGASAQEITERAADIAANPTSGMVREAKNRAAEFTFTNDLGKLGGLIQAMRSESVLARVALPFFKTPANIVKFAGKRSPLAPFAKSVREDLAAGGAKRAHAIARMSLGTAIGTTVAALAGGGNITGGGPRDPKLRGVWWASGRQPYSVKVGDTYYSYGRVEPFGMLMGVAADMVELSNVMSDAEVDDIGGLVFGSIATNLVSKTWLRGPSELLQAVFDPERYGDRYVRNLGASIVPNILNQTAQAIDPNLREARNLMDAIKNRVPIIKEGLTQRRDVFGEGIELGSGGFTSLISPIFVSDFENDPAAEELLRLKVGVSKVPKTISGVKLNDQQLDTFRKLAGSHVQRDVAEVQNREGYNQLSDDDKRTVLRSVMRRAREKARTELKRNDFGLQEDISLRGSGQKRDRILRKEFR